MASRKLLPSKWTLRLLTKSSNFTSVRCQSVWTAGGIIKSPYQNIDIPNGTLYDYVWQNLDKWPERTATVCAHTGRGYTYNQLFKLSNAFGASLRTKFKIRDGNAVAVMLPNIPDYPIVSMGILEAGGIITTINPLYTSHEVHRQLLLSDAKSVVTLPELANTIKDALKLAKLDIPIIVVKTTEQATPDGTVAFNELSEDPHIDTSCLKEVRRNADDICFLPYSSGTTGLPKGVELTNKNIVAQCEQINEPIIRCHHETTAAYQDVVMGVLPFFHIYGASVIMFHKLSLGMKVVTIAKFSPDIYLEALVKFKTNTLFVAPPIVLLMASHPAASPETYQYIETIINGAAPLAASDGERLLEKVQHEVDFRQGYGLTETSPTVALSPRNSKMYASVGHAIPSTELRIVDSNLKNLGPNETGELLIRGPQVMKGYRNNPEANAQCLVEDGWFRSGDLSTVDEHGVLTIADRLKELIKVKGFQVPPAELEGILRDHPAVNDAAVIGVPDPINGEAPKAFIVLNKGAKAEAKEISEYVKAKVAPFKRINDIVFLDSIPKSAAGKILRKDLKEKYC